MIITCEKCGGNNTPPEGKTTFFCSFCGNQLDAMVKKEEKQKVGLSRKGSDKETVLEYVRGGSKGILNLPMADLKGIHLKGANLEGANLSGANLKNSCFDNANLKNANFKDANLVNAKFINADLSGANLCGTVFEDNEENWADFHGATLIDALFINSEINCDFQGIKSLKGADFSGCNFLENTVFEHLNLEGAKFVGAFLDGASMAGANLRSADLSCIISGNKEDIGKSILYGKRLFLNKSNLSNAILKNAQLINASLVETDLTGADLSGADLRGAKFVNIEANCKAAFVVGYLPAIAKNANFSGCDLRYANLIGVDLSTANLHGANLEGALLKVPAEVPAEKKSKFCYLTTACVEAMHLPDNCHELQTLRNFRDGYVSETQVGRELIQEYYSIAPEIIEAVNATGNSPVIFMNLYSEISEIVSLIDNNKPIEAYQSYCDMTLMLKKKYLSEIHIPLQIQD